MSLWKMEKRRRVLFKVILLGDSGVGKTSLMNWFMARDREGNNRMPYRCTIGFDFTAQDVHIGDKITTLQLWDTAGD